MKPKPVCTLATVNLATPTMSSDGTLSTKGAAPPATSDSGSGKASRPKMSFQSRIPKPSVFKHNGPRSATDSRLQPVSKTLDTHTAHSAPLSLRKPTFTNNAPTTTKTTNAKTRIPMRRGPTQQPAPVKTIRTTSHSSLCKSLLIKNAIAASKSHSTLSSVDVSAVEDGSRPEASLDSVPGENATVTNEAAREPSLSVNSDVAVSEGVPKENAREKLAEASATSSLVSLSIRLSHSPDTAIS